MRNKMVGSPDLGPANDNCSADGAVSHAAIFSSAAHEKKFDEQSAANRDYPSS